MTYDLQAEGVASHHTPLYGASESYPQSVDLAVRSYVEAGIPRSKIMIGAAFYGRSFTLKQSTSQPVWSPATGTGKSLSYDRPQKPSWPMPRPGLTNRQRRLTRRTARRFGPMTTRCPSITKAPMRWKTA